MILLVVSGILLVDIWADLQFLPQDKVVEFARLSPVELLRETQKAIGDSRLADLHKKLMEENVKCNASTRVSKRCRLIDSWTSSCRLSINSITVFPLLSMSYKGTSCFGLS